MLVFQLFGLKVVEKLAKIYGPDMYRHENVMLSATHTHSGPGGYFQYLLYIITQEGFIKDSTKAIVEGIIRVRHCGYCLEKLIDQSPQFSLFKLHTTISHLGIFTSTKECFSIRASTEVQPHTTKTRKMNV